MRKSSQNAASRVAQERRRRRKAERRNTRSERREGQHKGPISALPGANASPGDPAAFYDTYETASSVYGERIPAEHLVERIQSYEWRESFIRLSALAAEIGNDADGPRSISVCRRLTKAILASTASSAAAQRYLNRARSYIRGARRPLVVAHEEVIAYVQHLVLLYGGADAQEAPADTELALWLLGAADYLHEWSNPDSRTLSAREESIADVARVYRYNRRGDPFQSAVRTYELFSQPPQHGSLSGKTWDKMQEIAFEGGSRDYFETFLFPIFLQAHNRSASDLRTLTLYRADDWKTRMGERGETFIRRLREFTASRDFLQRSIRDRMLPDDLLPHAPTTLLHHPFVDLEEHGIISASPWRSRELLSTGIWAKCLRATKALLGDSRAEDWTRAFGLIFEGWLGRVARMAEASGQCSCQVIIPTHPGAADEIEDVVILERSSCVLFSAKGTMMNEATARHATSRSSVVDWYEKFLFGRPSGNYRGGALRQLSNRIDMLRSGNFEPRVPRDAPVFPVLVTFDELCESQPLHAWIRERCEQEGVLQQINVFPLTLAHVQDFERIAAHIGAGGSIVEILTQRAGAWRDRRLDIQLSSSISAQALPELRRIYATAAERLMAWLQPERTGVPA